MNLQLLSLTLVDPTSYSARMHNSLIIFVYLCGRILIAINSIQSLFRGICDVFGRIIAAAAGQASIEYPGPSRIGHSQEALTHIYDWLHWGRRSSFVDNSPGKVLLARSLQC